MPTWATIEPQLRHLPNRMQYFLHSKLWNDFSAPIAPISSELVELVPSAEATTDDRHGAVSPPEVDCNCPR